MYIVGSNNFRASNSLASSLTYYAGVQRATPSLFACLFVCFIFIHSVRRLLLLKAKQSKPHDQPQLFDSPINGSALRRVGQEGPEALHHHQVQRELDRGRARQVPRSSSAVSLFFCSFNFVALSCR